MIKVKELLEAYDQVFMVMESHTARLMFEISKRRAFKRRLLVLSTLAFIGHTSIKFAKIEADEALKLQRNYYLYEFSDRFQVVSKEDQFGTLYQYVETGILTDVEMVEALLYESKGTYGSVAL